jgi:hypothetical protein
MVITGLVGLSESIREGAAIRIPEVWGLDRTEEGGMDRINSVFLC